MDEKYPTQKRGTRRVAINHGDKYGDKSETPGTLTGRTAELPDGTTLVEVQIDNHEPPQWVDKDALIPPTFTVSLEVEYASSSGIIHTPEEAAMMFLAWLSDPQSINLTVTTGPPATGNLKFDVLVSQPDEPGGSDGPYSAAVRETAHWARPNPGSAPTWVKIPNRPVSDMAEELY